MSVAYSNNEEGDHMTNQIITLFLLALPIACAAWTVTHEEVFREPREFCQRKSKSCKKLLARKFFYLPTCEYCFSHYVTAAALLATGFKLQFTGGWVDYVLTGFTLVWIANFYMGVFFLLKLTIKFVGAKAKTAAATVTEDAGVTPKGMSFVEAKDIAYGQRNEHTEQTT